MTAQELITILQTLHPNTRVTVWNDGEEHDIFETDTIDYDDETKTAQINTRNSDQYANN
jgi:hypothetical protein